MNIAKRLFTYLFGILIVLAVSVGCTNSNVNSDKSKTEVQATQSSEQNNKNKNHEASDSHSDENSEIKNKDSESVSSNSKDLKGDSLLSKIKEDQEYTSKEDVHLYLVKYKKLPKNYITKEEAKKLGWDISKNNLSDIAVGKSIGGDRFGNYENKLPMENGRVYKEADIGYTSGHRNTQRLVYSNDGLYYYTSDHYKTFEQLASGGSFYGCCGS